MSILTNQNLGQLFRIPEEDWAAINQRVGNTASAAGIANYIKNYIPEFPNLIVVCNLWKDQTFNGLIQQSAAINRYTVLAVNRFQNLLNVITSLPPSQDQVPESIQNQTKLTLLELGKWTGDICKQNEVVNRQIRDFLAINTKVDAEMLRFKEKLGIFWDPLGQTITRLDNATGLVTGSWLAISADLGNYASASPDINMSFLLQLDIEVAIVNWKSLQAESEAFMQISDKQRQYWHVENLTTPLNLH